MKIIHIIPGSGNTFYCENCLRDSALVKALRRHGHDVLMAPMYLPMFSDTQSQSREAPVFFGAVRLYLTERFKWARKLPLPVQKLLDSSPALKIAARMAGSTNAQGLDELTLAMLQCDHENISNEADRLIDWLESSERPEVVHLSNALLLGLAPKIKNKLKTSLVCSLQDESAWIDPMLPEMRRRIRKAMAERARYVDAFVAPSEYYSERMRDFLQLDPARIRLVHVGIDLDEVSPHTPPFDPPVIGYLSRITSSMGFDILVDAFLTLKREAQFNTLKLRVTGGSVGEDKKFILRLKDRLAAAKVLNDVEFIEDLSREARLRFLDSLTLLSVPSRYPEAFGTFQIEAMAAGVPVVQPAIGAYPEIIEATGGGKTYDPNTPQALASAINELLSDPDNTAALGKRGSNSVFGNFSIDAMARKMVELYSQLLELQ